MLAKIVKLLSLVVFLFVHFLDHKHVLADSGPQPPPPIASTNVSIVSTGSAFTMKCQMPDNYTIGKEQFDMYFRYIITGSFTRYTIPASTSGLNKRLFHTTFNDKDEQYIASIQPVNSTTTVTSNTFEISITTTKNTFSAQFDCLALYNGYPSFHSNRVPITTIAPSSPPKPILISSVSHVSLHHPFTLTCSLPSQFNPNNTAYQVAFLNSRDGLMADYKVDGKVFLVSENLANASVLSETRTAFPIFDLQITEKVDQKLSYWCQLLVVNSTTQQKNISLESAHWKPVGPFVDFSSNNTESERRGRCSIDEWTNFSNQEYQVLFYSDFGTKTGVGNLMGYFLVRPHRVTQFVTEKVTHWATIVHGGNVEYPNFEVIGKLESDWNVSQSKWWCSLNYIEHGQSSARLIKSNVETL